jgi:hypothetical protein
MDREDAPGEERDHGLREVHAPRSPIRRLGSRAWPKIPSSVPSAKTYALVLGVALAASVTSLRNGFVYDDVPVVVENHALHSLDSLPGVITSAYWSQSFRDRAFRPATLASFAVDWAVGGGRPLAFGAKEHALSLPAALLLADAWTASRDGEPFGTAFGGGAVAAGLEDLSAVQRAVVILPLVLVWARLLAVRIHPYDAELLENIGRRYLSAGIDRPADRFLTAAYQVIAGEAGWRLGLCAEATARLARALALAADERARAEIRSRQVALAACRGPG